MVISAFKPLDQYLGDDTNGCSKEREDDLPNSITVGLPILSVHHVLDGLFDDVHVSMFLRRVVLHPWCEHFAFALALHNLQSIVHSWFGLGPFVRKIIGSDETQRLAESVCPAEIADVRQLSGIIPGSEVSAVFALNAIWHSDVSFVGVATVPLVV